MADPYTQFFGGSRPFTGTGRVSDYFGPPPDMDFLNPGADFLPPDANYDPDLDADAMLSRGVPLEAVRQLQGIRMATHDREARRRLISDAQGAMQELNKIDPSRETFAKDLLSIFQKYPNADKSPEFSRKLNLVGQFARMMPVKEEEKIKKFKLDAIQDPEIRAQAIAEKWDQMDESSGKIRAYDAEHRKKQKLELVQAGYSPDQIMEMEKTGGLTDLGVLHAMNQLKAKNQLKPERTIPSDAAKIMAELDAESMREREALASTEGKLAYLRMKYDSNNPQSDKTTFTKQQWDEAHRAALMPNKYDIQKARYASYLNLTPSTAEQAISPLTESASPAPADSTPVIRSKAEYDALPPGTQYIDSQGNRATKKK